MRLSAQLRRNPFQEVTHNNFTLEENCQSAPYESPGYSTSSTKSTLNALPLSGNVGGGKTLLSYYQSSAKENHHGLLNGAFTKLALAPP